MIVGISKEDILQIARECGFAVAPAGNGYWDNAKDLERFAHRIERETLLKAAELFKNNPPNALWEIEEPLHIVIETLLIHMAEQIGKE